jgi:hypothetical protein
MDTRERRERIVKGNEREEEILSASQESVDEEKRI